MTREQLLVGRGKEVGHGESTPAQGQLEETVTIIRTTLRRPITTHAIDGTGAVRRQPAPTLPNAAILTVRSVVPNSHLIQADRVVRKYPTVVRSVVAMRGKGNIDGAIHQQQCRPL